MSSIGFAASTPAVGATGVDVTNTNPYEIIIIILTVGTVTACGITDFSGTLQSITTTLSAGMHFHLHPGCKIRFTYTVAPTWKWYGLWYK